MIAAKVGGTGSGKRAAIAHMAHDPGDEAEFAWALAALATTPLSRTDKGASSGPRLTPGG
ncbi:MAG TPA: hypothetical protein VF060_23950 [Trebonia sp.]